MARISILDCTLRDGGYVNDFKFGNKQIKSIIKKLSNAGIDIVECGFLKHGASDPDKSLFDSVEAVKSVIKTKYANTMYVAMIQYGKIGIDEICDYDGSSIDGIRLTFHEHEIDDAIIAGNQLMEKGYKVFMQPVGTTTYTDGSLLKLIERINAMMPYAFYMVDTLGTMYKNDLLRMFYIIDHNLDKHINLGFHSHNNLQMSFANAQELMSIGTERNVIIDASILGMGRGAGNLNTELVTQYINVNFGLRYDNLEILEIMDQYIRPLSLEYQWGYDAAYYLAAILGCHPNYAAYLLNMQTLHVQDIKAILSAMDAGKRALFDKEYIAEQYIKYMDHAYDDSATQKKIADTIAGKKVLVLAPGKSLSTMTEKVNELIETGEYYPISVNFRPSDIGVKLVFISNLKRFTNNLDMLEAKKAGAEVVVTSNIASLLDEDITKINYSSYLNEEDCIVDNSGLMCLNLMKKLGVNDVTLAGFDGFSESQKDNYFEESLSMTVEQQRGIEINKATAKKIEQLSQTMKISFLSDSAYEK